MKRQTAFHSALSGLAAAGLSLALCATAPAADNVLGDRYTKQELSLLPQYCRDVFGLEWGRLKPYWLEVMGEMAERIHHYCYGLAAVNSVNLFGGKMDPRWRVHNLNYAVTEFDYMMAHSHQGGKLMPEILTKKGEVLIQLKRFNHATDALLRAISLKPDYWPPYAGMSDVFEKLGDIAQAREWVEKGLKEAPESKTLKSRLADLDRRQGKRGPVQDERASRTASGPAPAASGKVEGKVEKQEQPAPAEPATEQ